MRCHALRAKVAWKSACRGGVSRPGTVTKPRRCRRNRSRDPSPGHFISGALAIGLPPRCGPPIAMRPSRGTPKSPGGGCRRGAALPANRRRGSHVHVRGRGKGPRL